MMTSVAPTLTDQLLSNEWRTLFAVTKPCAQLEITMIEELLKAELSHHIELNALAGQREMRNGYWKRTMPTRHDAKIVIRVPRDRANRFESLLLPHHRRHFYGFTDRILAMYVGWPKAQQIKKILVKLYESRLTRDLTPYVIDAAFRVLHEWHEKPLSPSYPVALFASLPITSREWKWQRARPTYFALGLLNDGSSVLLGLWSGEGDDRALWTNMLTDLAFRGLEQIAVVLTSGACDELAYPSDEIDSTMSRQCKVNHVHKLSDLASAASRWLVINEIERQSPLEHPPYARPGAAQHQGHID